MSCKLRTLPSGCTILCHQDETATRYENSLASGSTDKKKPGPQATTTGSGTLHRRPFFRVGRVGQKLPCPLFCLCTLACPSSTQLYTISLPVRATPSSLFLRALSRVHFHVMVQPRPGDIAFVCPANSGPSPLVAPSFATRMRQQPNTKTPNAFNSPTHSQEFSHANNCSQREEP